MHLSSLPGQEESSCISSYLPRADPGKSHPTRVTQEMLLKMQTGGSPGLRCGQQCPSAGGVASC